MKTLWIDTETFSETPIKNGTYRYCSDCEIMLLTYAFYDSEVFCWDLAAGEEMPDELAEALLDDSITIIAHNVLFDRTVLRTARNTNPILQQAGENIERWQCNLVRALAHSLPGSLDKLCEIFNLADDVAKQKDGKALIRLFCCPRPAKSKLLRATAATHPAEWQRFTVYAKSDILAMRIISAKIPDWNYPSVELSHWHLDQKINDRGVLIDLTLAHAAIAAAEEAKATLSAECLAMTNGEVESATKRDKLLAHLLLEYGIDLPDLQASTLERRVNDPDLPEAMRELLINRMQASMGSTSKYKAMLKAVNDDGRARGLLQFDGAARTGRWCLAEGSRVPVVTLDGAETVKNIEDVLDTDLVWDGDFWVAHEGVVFSGDKPVVEHDGVVATSEHNVYTSTSEHITLGEAAALGVTLWRGNDARISGL